MDQRCAIYPDQVGFFVRQEQSNARNSSLDLEQPDRLEFEENLRENDSGKLLEEWPIAVIEVQAGSRRNSRLVDAATGTSQERIVDGIHEVLDDVFAFSNCNC